MTYLPQGPRAGGHFEVWQGMGATGGTPPTRIEIAELQAQVQRFYGPHVPEAERIGPYAFTPMTWGELDVPTAATAMAVVLKRTQQALELASDPESRGRLSGVFVDATFNLNNTAYVAAHLRDIKNLLSLYGDSRGLAPASVPIFVRMGVPSWAPWAAVGAIGYLFLKGRR